MKDPDLDQPSLHRIVPPLEGQVWGGWYSHAVLVDRKERLRFDAPYSCIAGLKAACGPSCRLLLSRRLRE